MIIKILNIIYINVPDKTLPIEVKDALKKSWVVSRNNIIILFMELGEF